jgi:hypothetical protein
MSDPHSVRSYSILALTENGKQEARWPLNPSQEFDYSATYKQAALTCSATSSHVVQGANAHRQMQTQNERETFLAMK